MPGKGIVEAVRALLECPHLRIEIGGTRFCGPEEDVILEVESEDVAMGGIQFLTDEKGRKTAAVIDLKVHKALWEDIQDVLVSKARRLEKGVSLDKVKAG